MIAFPFEIPLAFHPRLCFDIHVKNNTLHVLFGLVFSALLVDSLDLLVSIMETLKYMRLISLLFQHLRLILTVELHKHREQGFIS